MNKYISSPLVETFIRGLRKNPTWFVGLNEHTDGTCHVTIIESEDDDHILRLVIPPEDNERLRQAGQAAMYIVEHEHLAKRMPRVREPETRLFFWRQKAEPR